MKRLKDRRYAIVNGVWGRYLGKFAYSDGDEVEERLASIVRTAGDVSVHSEELASQINDWPTRYHFGAERANLVRPLASQLRGAWVLEIGAGCGGITRFLGETNAKVLAVEGSVRRARIAADRCRDLPNVTVVADAFDDFDIDMRFDVVTLIGVLEYARIYSKAGAADPIQAMLARASSFLKEDGKLVVAIENQLGLKYFSGHPEDHLSVPFAGIEDSYGQNGVVTFGRVELERRLNAAGLRHQQWLYPFPDYKLPTAVLSEKALRTPYAETMVDLVSAAVDNDPQPISNPTFDIGGALEALSRNDLLPDLANSFLAVASARDFEKDFFAATYSATGRRQAFRKATSFVEAGPALEVRRERLFPAQPLEYEGVKIHLLPSERVAPGRLWSAQLRKIVRRRGWSLAEVTAWAVVWQKALCELAVIPPDSPPETLVPGRCIDAVPRNLLVDGGMGQFIDLEWSVDWPLTYADALYRSIFTSLAALPEVAAPAADVPHSILELFLAVVSSLGCSMDLDTIAKAEQSEDRFIECAVGSSLSVSTLRERTLRIRW